MASNAAPHNAERVSYGFMAEQLRAGMRVTVADDKNGANYSANFADTTYYGYTVIDLYVSWEPAPASLAGLKVDLTANNIEDKRYRVA